MKQQRYNLLNINIIGAFASIIGLLVSIISAIVNPPVAAVVAIISVIGLFFAFLIRGKPVAEKKIKRVWLVIEKVELFGPLINGQFNLKALVNNTSYKYPSTATH